jgi:hypothetical protein
MAGNVAVAQRRGQGWCGGSFGLKPERKRKAMEGLLFFFCDWGKKRSKEAGGGASGN